MHMSFRAQNMAAYADQYHGSSTPCMHTTPCNDDADEYQAVCFGFVVATCTFSVYKCYINVCHHTILYPACMHPVFRKCVSAKRNYSAIQLVGSGLHYTLVNIPVRFAGPGLHSGRRVLDSRDRISLSGTDTVHG
eukprot:scpid100824/ scgid27602/ 